MNIDPGIGAPGGIAPQPYRGSGRAGRGRSRGRASAAAARGSNPHARSGAAAQRGGRSRGRGRGRGNMEDDYGHNSRGRGGSQSFTTRNRKLRNMPFDAADMFDDEPMNARGGFTSAYKKNRGRGDSQRGGRGGGYEGGGKGQQQPLSPLNMNSSFARTMLAFAKTRYNEESKFLDMSSLAQADEIASLNPNCNNRTTMHNIISLIAQAFPDTETLSLDSNGIKYLSGFTGFNTSLPGVTNLSLKENLIHSFDQLDYLRGCKFHEIVLFANPCSESSDDRSYHHELCKRFPTLRFIDGQEPQGLIKFDIPDYVTSTALPEVKPSYYDTPTTQEVATAFAMAYFNIFDSGKENRKLLMPAYADASLFSLSIPGENQGKSPFIPVSRNFLKVKGDARKSRCMKGSYAIVEMLCQLPPTQHLLTDIVHVPTVDSFVLPCNGSHLMVCVVKGAVEDTGSAVGGPAPMMADDVGMQKQRRGDDFKRFKYLFSRIFILAPKPGGGPANSQSFPADNIAGWPVVIANEQWTLWKAQL